MYGLLWSDNIWPRYNYLKIWNLRVQKHQTFEKIAFKVVQIKFLAMIITKRFWYIYGKKCTKYLHGKWSLINVLMIFNNFDPYDVFLAFATNIPQRLKTAFVLQGHTY